MYSVLGRLRMGQKLANFAILAVAMALPPLAIYLRNYMDAIDMQFKLTEGAMQALVVLLQKRAAGSRESSWAHQRTGKTDGRKFDYLAHDAA